MARVLVLVALAAIVGAAAAAPVPKDGPKPLWKFPTQVGTRWVYAESGDRDIQITESITSSEEESGIRLLRVRYESEWVEGGATWGVIDFYTLWMNEEGLFETSGKPNIKPTFLLLKIRCSPDDVWERKGTGPAEAGKTESRVVAEEKVKVPAGTFDSIRIETKRYVGRDLSWTRNDWYAAGIGLVKSTGGSNDKRVRVLKSFTGKK